MARETFNTSRWRLVNWLQTIGRTVGFSDYENVANLQRLIALQSSLLTGGHVEAAIHKRYAAIRMWHYIVPLSFGFIPMWLIWIIPLFRVMLPGEQIAVIVGMMLLTGICYLLTFHKDAVKYRCHLFHVRQNLLSAFQKQVSSFVPPQPEKPIPLPKGSIRILLLNELVKKDAGHPNLFDAAINDALPMYQKMIGFNEKHFKKMMPEYRRKQDIILDQENARTTHVKYLEYIIQHYKGTGEVDLERQAISLQTFLNTTPLKAAG